MEPQALIEELLDVEPARPRRRRLPDGPQGELPRQGHAASRRTSSSTPTSPSRARSRTARSWRGPAPADRGLPDHRARDRVRPTSSSTSAASTWPSTRSLRAALDEARAAGLLGDVDDRPAPRRGRVHLRRGDGAARVARGQARPAALAAAVPGRRRASTTAPTLINNVETIATVPTILELGGAEFAKIGAPTNSTGHARLLALRQRRARPATTSSCSASTLRELIYDARGGIPDGRELKAVIPGGSSVPGADRRPDRHAARLRLAGRRRARSSAPASVIVDRRPLLHGAARAAGRAVLHARVVRQVHAVPRGDALDGADPRARSRTGAAEQSDLDLLLDVCDRILGKSLCALGDAAAMPVASYVDKFRAEFQAHIDAGGCPFGGESSLEGIVAPVEQHTHHPPPRCRREHVRDIDVADGPCPGTVRGVDHGSLATGSEDEARSFFGGCSASHEVAKPPSWPRAAASGSPSAPQQLHVSVEEASRRRRARIPRSSSTTSTACGRASSRRPSRHATTCPGGRPPLPRERPVRQPHRVPRGRGVSAPELVTLTIDGVEVAGAEGHRARRGGARGRDRDPRLLLRAAARAARRRLPHVPLRGARACRSRRPPAR